MQSITFARDLIRGRPYVSLAIFVIIVVVVSVAGYARYQHVQAELEAQQDIRFRIQREFDDWRDDLSTRVSDFNDGILGTAQGAGNVVGGAWRIIKFVTKAVLDYIGNLHIMIPVTIIYFGVGFFGTLKMRVATLLGALIAFWVSTSAGIIQGSVIGLLAIAGLLLWNKIDPRLLSAIQNLPARLKTRLQQIRQRRTASSAGESEPLSPADSP
ncbi:MAG: hypothetical protein OXI34_16585 [Chloroflexota bacterium]|nr:hypothetical protein [Chloroflexota bacterium]MDE2948730.1 hypothetical protein [Chloroflexota bacterium]